MSLLRIVAAPSASPTVIFDLWPSNDLAPVAGTFTISTDDPLSQTGSGGTMALSETELDGRYEGYRTDFEKRTNGSLQWTCLIHAGSPLLLEQAIAALISQGESAADAFIEWRPLGQPSSLFFERRGPGSWKKNTVAREQGLATIDIVLPVAPASRGVPFVTTATQTVPSTFALGAIPGTLPALVDVSLDLPASPLAWGLIAPYAPAGAPTGMFQAAALTPVGLALTANGTAQGGQDLEVASVVAGTHYRVSVPIDASLFALDGFESDAAIEIWVRAGYNAATMLGASVIGFAYPPAGIGVSRYTEFGPSGRAVGDASSGATWRIHRAGIIRLPSETGSGQWTVAVDVVPGVGSSGQLGINWLMLVPARHRASSPTGVPPSAAYPRLLATSAVAQTKNIDHSGKGSVSLVSGVAHSDTGLGGAPLMIEPGASGGVVIAVSPSIPDDPSASAGNDTFSNLTARITVTPRYSLWSAP